MADIEKELKKVRDEAAQRRVELAPYKKAFESFDEARLWATNLAEAIIIGGFWSEEELVMEHREVI